LVNREMLLDAGDYSFAFCIDRGTTSVGCPMMICNSFVSIISP
jgi:hypothetical protein